VAGLGVPLAGCAGRKGEDAASYLLSSVFSFAGAVLLAQELWEFREETEGSCRGSGAREGQSMMSLQLTPVPTCPLCVPGAHTVRWETLAWGKSRKAFHERKQNSIPSGAGREAGFPA